MLKKILLFTLMLPSIAFADMCQTHQPCTPGTTCSCNVGASGAYARYFYIDFSNIQKNTHYTCHFSNTMAPFSFVFEASTFPEGVTYQCAGNNCPRFPADLQINTEAMNSDSAKMIIKFLVPASDIPAEVTTRCDVTN